jgi:hypothetical protein
MAEFVKLILLVVFMQQDANNKNKEKAVFQDDSAPFTQPEMISHGLKRMKMNFSIFPGQHNHQI